MTIAAKDVKILREKTGVGMMDCKVALQEAGGNMGKALVILREKGLAGVNRRAGRKVAEGVISCVIRDNRAVMVEVNCETDFVARNKDFQSFAHSVAEHILSQSSHDDQSSEDAGGLMGNESWYRESGRKVNDILGDTMAKIGENVKIRRFTGFIAKSGGIAEYVHAGGRIGVMVEYAAPVNSNEINSVVRDVAMHVAAINPSYLSRDKVTVEDLKREEDIYRKQVLDQGKPPNIVDRIVKGKMGKFYSEVCLFEQPFVKDPGLTVMKYLEEQGKKHELRIDILRYKRFQVGEGVESKE